jgi:acyl-CoA synthetase (AMP-forming)/AMP-acid ligase II
MHAAVDTTLQDGATGRGRWTGWPAGLVEIVRARALEAPERTAFQFYDASGEVDVVSRGGLDRETCSVAAALQANDVGRALLLHPPGRDYVTALLGCFYAGVVAVPAYPPDPTRLDRTLPRLLSIVADARPEVVLTTAAIKPGAEELLRGAGVDGVTVIASDEAAASGRTDWTPPVDDPERLALLQYTSGSTASPRGVMVTFANLLGNCAFISRAFGTSEQSQGVIWLPPYHDMGLIGGIVQPLYGGLPCVLMSPVDFLRRPVRWLEAVSRFGGTMSGGPNFSYDLCLRRVSAEDKERLDLSTWEVAFNGAEPIRPGTMDAFSEAFGECGFRREAFYPCYGLAEGTLMVTGVTKLAGPRALTIDGDALGNDGIAQPARGGDGAKTVVSCGRPDEGHAVVIADPTDRTPCAPGTVGEIFIAGPNTARGYWGQTRGDTFGVKLRGREEEDFVATGDLGFMVDGELYVTGRAKEVIIVAGRNHSPADIELACEEAAPELRRHCGAAFALPGDDRERVGVVYEVQADDDVDMSALIRRLRTAVNRAVGLQLHAVTLIRPKTLPKTSSGKVQRLLCRSLYEQGRLEEVASWSV